MSGLPSAGLELVPLRGHAPDRDVLRTLARDLRDTLGSPVRIAPPIDAPVDARGGSMDSGSIVRLLARTPGGAVDSWRLTVANIDLTAAGRTFVFGEATLGGRWAVVSTAHLSSPGTPASLVRSRLLKASLHEVGHLAGLLHCDDTGCVMAAAEDAADVDEKRPAFCERCAPSMHDLART